MYRSGDCAVVGKQTLRRGLVVVGGDHEQRVRSRALPARLSAAACSVQFDPVPAMMRQLSPTYAFARRNSSSFSQSDRVADSPVVPQITTASMPASICRRSSCSIMG